VSPGPPTPTDRPESPQQWSFLGGSLFTSPPEEDGDLLTESRRRGSWWGGGKDSLLQRRASRTGKKSDKEGRCSDKETSKEKPAKVKKEESKGESKGEEDRGETVEVEENVKSEGPKREVRKGDTEYPGKVEKKHVRVEVVGDGSLPVGKDRTGEVPAIDEQLKAETEDDTATPPRDAKSLSSLSSSKSTKGSRGGTKPGGKRWSLMIPRKSTPEDMPMPSRKLTDDVAGPRFETVKEPGERCAGDVPSVYIGGFVSHTPPTCLYIS